MWVRRTNVGSDASVNARAHVGTYVRKCPIHCIFFLGGASVRIRGFKPEYVSSFLFICRLLQRVSVHVSRCMSFYMSVGMS